MKVRLDNVRLAFPALFTPKAIEGSAPAYSAAFIIPKDHPAVALVAAAIKEVAAERWGAKADENLKTLKAKDFLCMHDGDTKSQYEGFEGNLFVSARNVTRPKVLDQHKAPLLPDDGKPYSGCFVNAVIDVWAQDNKYGKRVNATLMGVQFAADGDAFTGGGVASDDDFADLADGANAPAGDLF